MDSVRQQQIGRVPVVCGRFARFVRAASSQSSAQTADCGAIRSVAAASGVLGGCGPAVGNRHGTAVSASGRIADSGRLVRGPWEQHPDPGEPAGTTRLGLGCTDVAVGVGVALDLDFERQHHVRSLCGRLRHARSRGCERRGG